MIGILGGRSFQVSVLKQHLGKQHGAFHVFFSSILLRSLSSKTSMDFLNSQENVGSWSEIWMDDSCVEDGNFVLIVAWFYLKVWTNMFLMFNVNWEKWINEDQQVWRYYHDPAWKWWINLAPFFSWQRYTVKCVCVQTSTTTSLNETLYPNLWMICPKEVIRSSSPGCFW